MDFCSQLRLLLWKMLLMKRRRMFGTLIELFLPVLLVSVLIAVREEVEIVSMPKEYGLSIPVFSVFNLDGFPVSLPGTLDAQDICLGKEINKRIAVTPNDADTRWFLGELEKYYHFVSDQTLLDYYNAAYFLDDVDNFRDLFILANNLLDLCVDTTTLEFPFDTLITVNATCLSFIELLNSTIAPIDIYDDEQLETLMGILQLEITDPDVEEFFDFLQDLNFDDLNATDFLEFNISDADSIAALLEFVSLYVFRKLVGLICVPGYH